MFTEIMRQYYIENDKKPKSKKKDPKSKKIEMHNGSKNVLLIK